MKKELLLSMCEFVNINVCDEELTVTDNFVGRGRGKDPHGCGISIGEWGCDTKKDQKHFATKLKKFIKAFRSYGLVCSDVIYEDSENVFVNIEYDDNEHIKTPYQIVRETKDTVTVKFGERKVTVHKSGKMSGADRYFSWKNVMVWDKNFKVVDGLAESYGCGYITDTDEEEINGHKLSKSQWRVEFPLLRDTLLDDDKLDDATYYMQDIGEFVSEGPDAEFYDELFEYMKEYKRWMGVFFFEGYFFADSVYAKWEIIK